MLLVLLFHLLLLSLGVTHTVHVPKATVPHFPSQREGSAVASGGIIGLDLRTKSRYGFKTLLKGRQLLPCTGRFDKRLASSLRSSEAGVVASTYDQHLEAEAR